MTTAIHRDTNSSSAGPGRAVRSVSVCTARTERYDVFIGNGLLPDIGGLVDLSRFTDLFLITDTTVRPLYAESLADAYAHMHPHICAVSPGEVSKSLDTYQRIQIELANLNFSRRGLVMNVGGGVVGDLGGFVAATYRRGVTFINVATTLEAMVDASVGGKTGINLNGWKNYIGAFAQPAAVISDISTLRTLDDRTYVAAWAEIVKHGLIFSESYYDRVTEHRPREYSDPDLISIVARSCEYKRNVVEEDEQETGARKILNFGHTIGHAIETISFDHEPFLHGEAVAIGMVAEAYIAQRLGLISSYDFDTLRQRLSTCGLPVHAPFAQDHDRMLELIRGDKKNYDGSTKWSLIGPIGTCQYDMRVSDSIVDDALACVLD